MFLGPSILYKFLHSVSIHLFKVNNGKTGSMFEICSKLTIKTPEERHCGVYIVNFGQISYFVQVFPFLFLNKQI